MRQVVLDTETTGINKGHNGTVCFGHRIVEIACIEMVDRRVTGKSFHVYVNPQCKVPARATGIHGITNQFLKDKPLFSDIAAEFIRFIRGAELIIHNAPFDIAFIDQEFMLLHRRQRPIGETFTVIDTLDMARQMFPGTRNDLDALCLRFGIEGRNGYHSALIDVRLLAKVYLMMT